MAKKSDKKATPYGGFDDADPTPKNRRKYLRHHGKYLLRVLEMREDQNPDEGDAFVAASTQVMHVFKGGQKSVAKGEVIEDDPVEVGDVRDFYWVTGGKWRKLGWADAKRFVMAAAGVDPTSQEASEINSAFFAVAIEEQTLRGEYLIVEQVLGKKGKKSENEGDPKIDTYCSMVKPADVEAVKAKFDGVPMPELQADEEKSDDASDDEPDKGSDGDDDIPF